ncbi:ZIP family metal transporter [Neptunitalea lumnitzerae]|uniref:Divalent cation transporter n=1 Tax=Neptunitalea lumnitzerae TaxID=2965509 RepID=A0ABQ5MMR8_9FLAO|nr:divalent cation transporter [Neptunitalea sp. Y10]GLB50686.1 divalent cation transporter [Neptunitalea sp. Y10]
MILKMVLFALLSGITVFVGGVLANVFNHHVKEKPVKYEIIHGLMSFGAGIMLSAVALVLVPTGMEGLSVGVFAVVFMFGALLFMWLDRYLAKKGGQTATLLAMMMDFIPESIALGATFALDVKMAMLLAVFIGLQNLPEAFNSFRDLVLSGYTTKKVLIIFFFLSFCGVVGALGGHYLLAEHSYFRDVLMTFSGGGILYLLIQDIIPESKLSKNYITSLGAIAGFLVGVVGEMVI